jgi:hypothetical protein
VTSLIGAILRAFFAFTVALYILYPRETGQWMRGLLETSTGAFCSKGAAPVPSSRVLLNRGHCAAPGKTSQTEKPRRTLQSMLGDVATAFNAER